MLKKHQISGLMDHLKINKAFIASQCSNDIEDFCSEYHNKILGLSLVVPITINSKKFSELDQKIMVLKSEFGVTANSVNTLKNEINSLEIIQLNNYEALAWSDICEDKSSETCEALISFFKGLNIENYSVNIYDQEGQFENISYKVIGNGPPLLLFPFFLSAKQWNPIIQKLSDFFTLVIIGGKDFGAIPSLEDRAELPTYKAMLETLVSNMNISKNGKVLELGCGPASLCRQVLKLRKDLSLVGVDINEYLLTEGSKIAQDQNFKVNPFFKDNSQPSRSNLKPNELNLSYSDATNISFPDNFFDAVYSVTVLEECDAQKSIAEIKRVLKPGGVAGIVVRALDAPQWWNIKVSDSVNKIISVPPQMVSPKGVADMSLYEKIKLANFKNILSYPFWFTASSGNNSYIYDMYYGRARQLLNNKQQEEFDKEIKNVNEKSQSILSVPLHCCIGYK